MASTFNFAKSRSRRMTDTRILQRFHLAVPSFVFLYSSVALANCFLWWAYSSFGVRLGLYFSAIDAGFESDFHSIPFA